MSTAVSNRERIAEVIGITVLVPAFEVTRSARPAKNALAIDASVDVEADAARGIMARAAPAPVALRIARRLTTGLN